MDSRKYLGAMAVGNMKRATSPEFKSAGHRVIRIAPRYRPTASHRTRIRCWRCSPQSRSSPISATALSVALISVVAPLIVYMVVPGSFGEWLSTLIPAGGIGLSNALLYKMISFDFLYAGGHAFFQADVLLASAPIKIVLLVGLAAWGYLRKTKVA